MTHRCLVTLLQCLHVIALTSAASDAEASIRTVGAARTSPELQGLDQTPVHTRSIRSVKTCVVAGFLRNRTCYHTCKSIANAVLSELCNALKRLQLNNITIRSGLLGKLLKRINNDWTWYIN